MIAANYDMRYGRGRPGSPKKDRVKKIDDRALKILYTQYSSFALLQAMGVLNISDIPTTGI